MGIATASGVYAPARARLPPNNSPAGSGSEQDQRRVGLEHLRALQAQDPGRVAADIEIRLQAGGLDAAAASDLVAESGKRAGGLPALAEATLPPPMAGKGDNPTARAFWMLASDLSASLLPVLPFALLPILPARVVSVVLTAALMLALGVWRARLGRRRTLPTALTTLGIAAAAGAVGLITGQLVDAWFGVG
ncbi:VIT1/CCC1 transporter family protein [Thiohalocapsa halophila]|nr:VIT1/CCC1 transporter family protein [Thiohalocapsa halophila]